MDEHEQNRPVEAAEAAPAVEIFNRAPVPKEETGGAVTAVFAGPADAQRAVSDLYAQGFPHEAIGIYMRDESISEELIMNPATRIAEGAAMGAVEGGLLGGALGFLVGALVVPGVGPIVAGGALASALAAVGPTALAGIGLGAATGGVVGALTGEPLPEGDEARLHEGVAGGGVAMIVRAGDRAADAIAILTRNNGDTGTNQGNLNPLYRDQPAYTAPEPVEPVAEAGKHTLRQA